VKRRAGGERRGEERRGEEGRGVKRRKEKRGIFFFPSSHKEEQMTLLVL